MLRSYPLIEPMVNKSTGVASELSFMILNDNKIDYVHWDDLNKLVERF